MEACLVSASPTEHASDHTARAGDDRRDASSGRDDEASAAAPAERESGSGGEGQLRPAGEGAAGEDALPGLKMAAGFRRRRPRMQTDSASCRVAIEPPEDVHFVAARLCLSAPQGSLFAGVGHLLAALGIVLLQLTVAWCLFSTMGNCFGACLGHGDCGRAMWCTVTPHPKLASRGTSSRRTAKTTKTHGYEGVERGGGHASRVNAALGMCLGCGFRDSSRFDLAPRFCHANGTASITDAAALQQAVEEPDLMGTVQHIYMELAMPDVAAMCAACVNERGFVPPLSAMNLAVIGLREGVMYVLVAIAASMCVMDEGLALFKTLLYIHRAALPEAAAHQCTAWRSKRVVLVLVQTARVFTLASVVMCVPLFVLFDSSDGVSILLNTVAALFILELDNFFFAYGVRELRRAVLLAPFNCTLQDATNLERAKELVALSSLLGICLVSIGAELEGQYLMIPWALVIAACTFGEVLIVCYPAAQASGPARDGDESVELERSESWGGAGGDGGQARSGACSCASWGVLSARLLVLLVLTWGYAIVFQGGTWWLLL